MKLIHLLVVVAFLGISASVALADGVDPIVFTQGCGRAGQPACDANILTSPGQTLAITLTFSGGLATDAIINESGVTITNFTVSFTVPSTLTFQGCAEGGFFTCNEISGPPAGQAGTAVFSLTGASLCSSDSNDWSISETGVATFVPDDDADDNCQSAFNLQLQTVAGEVIADGTRVAATVAAPEPSSGLLLLFGLSASLLAFKRLSSAAA